ncbi:MAG: hypothetical protein J5I93_20355 [Pirellulaceae bacterium]|nr:hypothetical protein [Pirellulaceae bacterium]
MPSNSLPLKPRAGGGHFPRTAARAVLVLVAGLCLHGNRPAVAEELDSLRFQDPVLVVTRRVEVYDQGLAELWLQALNSDEVDLQRQAADTIAMAHQRGVPGMNGTRDGLLDKLRGQPLHPLVQLAVARALLVLDARQAAPALAERLETSGLDYALIVEPYLARWQYEPLRDVWRKRLPDTRLAVPSRLLAIQGLGELRDDGAVDDLRRIVVNRLEPAGLRLAAARAIGRFEREELAEAAEQLADGPGAKAAEVEGLVSRLSAVAMLSSIDTPASRGLLLRLAEDTRPAVAGAALERLLAVAPADVLPLADRLLVNPDSKVRLLTAQTLATQPAAEQVPGLAGLLPDPHPDVRTFARQALKEFAQRAELDAPVRQALDKALQGEDWRGLEQASLLAAELRHAPAAGRLVQLLEHSRPEVLQTAAWALRVLAIPDTFPDMLAYARRQFPLLDQRDFQSPEAELTGPNRLEAVPVQLAHVFECFGANRYQECEPLLRDFVPKKFQLGHDARSAAIWSLGWLHEDAAPPGLAEQLAERLADLSPVESEDDQVRRFSAITLGRMKGEPGVETLTTFRKMEGNGTYVGRACGWALHRIQGVPLDEPGEFQTVRKGWFLEPLKLLP